MTMSPNGQGDGKILRVGTDNEAQPRDSFRRQPDNDPNLHSGNNGYVLANTVPLEGAVVGVRCVRRALARLSSLASAGAVAPCCRAAPAKWRFDTSFGQSGIVHIPVSQGAYWRFAPLLPDDDRIVLGYFQGSGFGRELGVLPTSCPK
ncbi:MAG: hypothetical protein U0176_21165 [Bacteroidia bacterium]